MFANELTVIEFKVSIDFFIEVNSANSTIPFKFTGPSTVNTSFKLTGPSAVSSSFKVTAPSAVNTSFKVTGPSAVSSSFKVTDPSAVSSSFKVTAPSAVSSSFKVTAPSAVSTLVKVTGAFIVILSSSGYSLNILSSSTEITIRFAFPLLILSASSSTLIEKSAFCLLP